jgi:hypothetical protein
MTLRVFFAGPRINNNKLWISQLLHQFNSFDEPIFILVLVNPNPGQDYSMLRQTSQIILIRENVTCQTICLPWLNNYMPPS